MVQFGAIIFCRTSKNYFDQFVWIEKSHYNSRVSLHEAPTKNERGTLWTKFALAVGGFRIVSKKWTDQCEDCSLKKQDENV